MSDDDQSKKYSHRAPACRISCRKPEECDHFRGECLLADELAEKPSNVADGEQKK